MVFLDNAATTLQKPSAVWRAVQQAGKTASSPGRGGYEAANRGAEIVYRCRETAAELFEAAGPDRVVFTANATHGLNIAIRSLVQPGDVVVISGYEHNAVTRTLAAIPGVTVRVADGLLFRPEMMTERFERLLDGAAAAVCSHVSNVFGYVLPLEQIAAACRKKGVPLVVDAAQSAGCLPVSVAALGAEYVAMPGHKGLYGPQGTGILLCGTQAQPMPLLYGGTGSVSRSQKMPDFLPDRLEAGTHNVPGVAGLEEGMRFVQRMGLEKILAHERKLCRMAAEGLGRLPGVEVYAAKQEQMQAGVLSLRLLGQDVERTAARLAERGIAVRAGLHCAPLAHKSAGTEETGTVRVSCSAFTTEEDIVRLLRAMEKML